MTKRKSIDNLTLALLFLALLYTGMYGYERWQAKTLYRLPAQVNGCALYIAGQHHDEVFVCDVLPQNPPMNSSEMYVRLSRATNQLKCPPQATAWKDCQTTLIQYE